MSKRILVADDDESLLTLLRVKLELSGYTVIAVTNGAQALGLAASKSPDVLLADVNMPVMDGLEMLQRLRAFSNVPVIIFSGGNHGAQALAAGANDYIAKPFDVDELVERIDIVLRSRRVASSVRSASS